MSRRLPAGWMDRLAHDLRGPLAPMQTAVYLLRDPLLDPQQRDELLTVLERQVQRLEGMIAEFGDLGLAGQGRLVAGRDPIDVDLLVADIATRLQQRPPRVDFMAGGRGLRLEGDVGRIAQLFHVLLGLRLSRSDPAPVQARIASAGGRLRMACAVPCRDATDDLGEALLRAPHPDPPDDALGFGLLIAEAIADAHGGQLRGRASAPDTLEFLLELPASAA